LTTFNHIRVWVTQGKTATFRVKLSRDPGTARSVSITKLSGSDEITVAGGANLKFKSRNWNRYQTITLGAANNLNNSNGTTLYQLSGSGLTSTRVTASKIGRSIR
jgi:hypothetical protein